MSRLFRTAALAAALLSAPALALAASGGHDDAGLGAERAGATFSKTATPADGLSPGTSHDDATYAPSERAPAQTRTAQAKTTQQERAAQKVASRCTCGHQS